MNVGFIGLGRMGAPMARCLLRAGFPLTVYNRTERRVLPLRELGAAVAESPAEVARRSDVVITMLAGPGAVADVVDGPAGVFSADLGTGLVLIEMSTIGPLAARELARRAVQRGVTVLDAPVSGSVPAAEAATLVTVVGGERGAFDRARPALAAMTIQQLWLGPSGAGAAMKLALNGMVAATNEALSEALVIAERSGVASELAYDAIAASAVGSRFVDYKRQAFLEPDDHPVAFSLELMQKDVTLYLELARRLRVPVPSAAVADQMLTVARSMCGGESDFAAVAGALRAIASEPEPLTLKEGG